MSYGSTDMLDLVVGGSFLPHVNCKNITLERNSENQSLINITLKLDFPAACWILFIYRLFPSPHRSPSVNSN